MVRFDFIIHCFWGDNERVIFCLIVLSAVRSDVVLSRSNELCISFQRVVPIRLGIDIKIHHVKRCLFILFFIIKGVNSNNYSKLLQPVKQKQFYELRFRA